MKAGGEDEVEGAPTPASPSPRNPLTGPAWPFTTRSSSRSMPNAPMV